MSIDINSRSRNKFPMLQQKKKQDFDREVLEKWLKEHNFHKFSRLNRDFSDAIQAARLIKDIRPKLVEMNNYPPRSNSKYKLDNWKTLNAKVLIKMGLGQNKSMLEKLASSQKGAIEQFLWQVYGYEKNSMPTTDAIHEQEKIWKANEECLTVNVNVVKPDGTVIQEGRKMLLYSIYEEKQRELRMQDMKLDAVRQKIEHVEKLMKLKDERITELTDKLAKMTLRLKKNKELEKLCAMYNKKPQQQQQQQLQPEQQLQQKQQEQQNQQLKPQEKLFTPFDLPHSGREIENIDEPHEKPPKPKKHVRIYETSRSE